MSNCKNCNQLLKKNANFCHQCGQNIVDYNDSFFSVIKVQLHELLDIDGRLSRTLIALLIKPGLLSKAYQEGKRVTYTPPLRLYLVISVLFFLLVAYLAPVYFDNANEINSNTKYYPHVMFLLFPFFALLVKLFFQSSRYLSDLVFSLHLHSLFYVVLLVILPLESFESAHPLLAWLQLPPALYCVWYYFKAFHFAFGGSWFLSAIKSSAIFVIYMGVLGIMFDVVLSYLA